MGRLMKKMMINRANAVTEMMKKVTYLHLTLIHIGRGGDTENENRLVEVDDGFYFQAVMLW